MEKFIRTVMLNGNIRAINLENCLYWDKVGRDECVGALLYMNGGEEVVLLKSSHSKLSWEKLVNDLENRTNRSWEGDSSEEKITDFPSLG